MNEKKKGLEALVDAAVDFRTRERELHLQLEDMAAQLGQWAESIRTAGDEVEFDPEEITEGVVGMIRQQLELLRELRKLRAAQPEDERGPLFEAMKGAPEWAERAARGVPRGLRSDAELRRDLTRDLGRGTVNSSDPDVAHVGAALADAAHAGGLSGAYYRTADGALERLAARVDLGETVDGVPVLEPRPGVVIGVDFARGETPREPLEAARKVALAHHEAHDGVGETIAESFEAYDRELWAVLAHRRVF